MGMKEKYTSPELFPLVNIEINWYKTFAFLPHRTINCEWVWLQYCYKRIVWRSTIFHIEPFTEYAQILDILTDDHDR